MSQRISLPITLIALWLAAASLALAEPEVPTRTVERVVDGDTLVLDGGERVRLIGVDTPETVHPQKPVEYFGKEASAFTRSMAEGERVRLEYEPGASTKGRYGRTLAYVYLEDGTLLNLAIIQGGLRVRLHQVSVLADGGVSGGAAEGP